jgi:hypothetical protein
MHSYRLQKRSLRRLELAHMRRLRSLFVGKYRWMPALGAGL